MQDFVDGNGVIYRRFNRAGNNRADGFLQEVGIGAGYQELGAAAVGQKPEEPAGKRYIVVTDVIVAQPLYAAPHLPVIAKTEYIVAEAQGAYGAGVGYGCQKIPHGAAGPRVAPGNGFGQFLVRSHRRLQDLFEPGNGSCNRGGLPGQRRL